LRKKSPGAFFVCTTSQLFPPSYQENISVKFFLSIVGNPSAFYSSSLMAQRKFTE